MRNPSEDPAVVKAMATLDTMSSCWAASFDLRGAVRAMMSKPDGENRLIEFIKQAHSEGLYDGRTSLQTSQPDPSGIPPGQSRLW